MQKQLIVFAMSVALAGATGGAEPVTLGGLDGWVGAVAFTPDGRKLAVGTSAGDVSIWDVALAKKFESFPGLKTVTALAFTPDGTTLVRGQHSPVLAVVRLNRD